MSDNTFYSKIDILSAYAIEGFAIGFGIIISYLFILPIAVFFTGFARGAVVSLYAILAIATVSVTWSLIGNYLSKKDYPTDEEEYPELHQIVEETAKDMNMKKPEIAVHSGDRPNAYASLIRPNRPIIGYYQPLLDEFSEREIKSTTAHELSHVRSRDNYISILLSEIHTFVELIHSGIKSFVRSDIVNTILFILPFIISKILLVLISLIYYLVKRSREYRADLVAATVVDAEARISVLEKYKQHRKDTNYGIKSRSLRTEISRKVDDVFFSTHPSPEDRIERLQKKLQ